MEFVSKGMNITKKILIALLATFILSFGLGPIESQIGLEPTDTASAALKDDIKKNNIEDLEKTVDGAGTNFVKLAREVAIVVAVILVILMAYSLFVKKSVEGLADMKGRLGGLLIALAFVFFTEQILGAIFGLFGVKIT